MLPPCFPAFFFETLDATKFEAGRPARLFRRYPCRDVIGNLLFQVEFQLGIELSFGERFMPKTTEPAHMASY
jgi:hypothetical protein